MRKITGIGAVLSGVGGILLAVYLNEAKEFLDALLSRLFGVPKGVVGYYVVGCVIFVAIAYFVVFVGFLVYERVREKPTKSLPIQAELGRKQAVWEAIKLWVELPITRFHDKQDVLPLAEKPPELAVEIEECLNRNYPSVYACLQKLRQEYHEWKNIDSSKRFIKHEKGRSVLNYNDLLDWNDFKVGEITRLHSQLAEQIKSEILAKHHTRLKC